MSENLQNKKNNRWESLWEYRNTAGRAGLDVPGNPTVCQIHWAP